MGRRIVAIGALALAVVTGCTRSEPAAGGSPAGAPTSTTDRASTTTVTVPRPALPAATPDATVRVPPGSVPGPAPIQGRVLAVDAGGSWVLRGVAGEPALVRVDPAGAPGAQIALPVDFVTAADPAVVDGTAWLAGSRDGPDGRTFHLVAADLASGTATALPSEAIVEQIDVVDGTTWVVTGGAQRSTRAYTATGPRGPGTPLPSADAADRLRPVVVVTPAAAFSCLTGTWTATPHGGATRDLGSHGDGCNAVPVGDDLVVADGAHLWRLTAGGATAIDGPDGIDTCTGPRQASTAPVALVCRRASTGAVEVVRVEPSQGVATVERSLGSGLAVPGDGSLPPRSAAGLPLAIVRDEFDPAGTSGTSGATGVLLVQGADGTTRAATVADDGAGWTRWTADAAWLGDRDGTWSRVPASSATG